MVASASILALSLVATLLSTSCGGSQGGAGEDPCDDSDIAVKKVWSEETRIDVRAQVMQWSGDIGVDVAERNALEITNTMDRLTDDWARMRRAVCNDHFKRQTLSKEEYQARVDCLDELLSRQRTFLSSLTSPRTDVARQLEGMNQALQECR